MLEHMLVLSAIDIHSFHITAWCNDCQLQIAVNKCSSILNIGPTTANVDLQIHGNVLPMVSTVKDPSITFDSNLSSTSYVG